MVLKSMNERGLKKSISNKSMNFSIYSEQLNKETKDAELLN